MESGTAIAYPSLMQSSEICFKYSSTGFSAVRLRMFCAGTDSSHSVNLLLGNTGNQFIAGQEMAEGQFENQVQIRTTPGDPVAVRLMIGSNNIELFLNDVSAMRIPFDPAKCAGSGLIIEPAGLWGNGVSPVSLSAFSAVSVPGRTWLPEIGSDIRKQVLTVPRFHKDDPPRHLLLATNGDVLRGEIEAATDSHFGFRSGLEELNIPRDRVKAVIWLKPALENPSAADAPGQDSPPNPLDRKIGQRMVFGGIGLKSLIAFLSQQAPDLKIKVPDNYDKRRIRAQFGGQTIREELDKICAMFDLRFRQEKDGTVVLEPTGQARAEFPRKSYWVKPGAIPATFAAQEFLLAKGVAFPEGASVEWQTDSGLLSMTNTPENQDKLAALLASDLGGNLGLPTHWACSLPAAHGSPLPSISSSPISSPAAIPPTARARCPCRKSTRFAIRRPIPPAPSKCSGAGVSSPPPSLSSPAPAERYRPSSARMPPASNSCCSPANDSISTP